LLEVLNSGGGGTYLALDLKTGIDIEENGIIKAKHAEGGRAEDERPEDEDQFEDEPKKRKKKVKLVAHEATLRETVGDAFADLIELAEECRELVDNVSDSPGLSQTQRILTFDETASALENLIKPNIPTGLENIKVTYSLPKRRNGARWARASHACDIITACEEALTSIETEDAQTLRGELEEVRSQAEYLEFPGMFG
jgi:hypothetical protein